MMGGMMGGNMQNMGGSGQNPFADMMRQMQDMQSQQGGKEGVTLPLLMARHVK